MEHDYKQTLNVTCGNIPQHAVSMNMYLNKYACGFHIYRRAVKIRDNPPMFHKPYQWGNTNNLYPSVMCKS